MKRDQLSECGGCGIPERFFLHNLRHRASYRRLCTNCVLKNHQGLFCPICLQVFNEPPPPYQRLICLKCPSQETQVNAGGSIPDDDDNDNGNGNYLSAKTRVIDKETAKALQAAAKIAAVSMTKAATVAKMEAERRVKETTLAKKRTKESLEKLGLLARKDNDRHKSSLLSTPKSRAKTNTLTLPSRIHEKGNNGSYSVSAANVPKLQLQHSAHGIPN
ncbi:Ribosomal protein L3 plastid isoform 1 [Hibiscus syriacus]|uniref:Ribosomal protein L3 plastid isoform 1 n=1 Tax=Hibiscus syriacus TaxID=106335 RepID=A0A6A3D304_HIBSY|nr:Ribosomal protein L3 plastid isoform 1 [Hibiscus syriacus]